MADKLTFEELKRQREEFRRKALASFPYAVVQAPGNQALTTWTDIRDSGQGSPVVVGGDEALGRVIEGASEWPGVVKKTTAELLEVASRIRYPDDLITQHAKDFELAATSSREGAWPPLAPRSPELSVAVDIRTGIPLPLTHLVILPTSDWTTIPAYLHWGGWNACPAPEIQVAALRSWRDRFGAELVGLSGDVMNIRVQKRPETRAAALDLAREQYMYCNDIIEQGVETLSALAAMLMESNWWYFWWD